LVSVCFAGEIRREVRGAQSLDAIGQMFNQATDYKRIYILQELENWKKEHNVSEAPSWLPAALTEAMDSRHPLLIREAVKLIGKYKYTSFSDSLVELYRNAHWLYTPEADVIRGEIITAVTQFDESFKKPLVSRLFLVKPRYYRSHEFFSLVRAIGQCGNSTHSRELQVIARELDWHIKEIDPKNDPGRNLGAYRAVLDAVVEAGVKIKERN
jgi:hypothetical protein